MDLHHRGQRERSAGGSQRGGLRRIRGPQRVRVRVIMRSRRQTRWVMRQSVLAFGVTATYPKQCCGQAAASPRLAS